MIEIRPARLQEAADVARLIMVAMTDECCLHFCGAGSTLEDFHRMMTLLVERDDSQYSYRNTLVALDADRVVGIAVSYDGALLHPLREQFYRHARQFLHRDPAGMADETQAGELYLDSLAVDVLYRGRGIATALLDATEKRACQLGIPLVGLLVDDGNPRAQRLYGSVGFEQAGTNEWGGHPMKHLVRKVRI